MRSLAEIERDCQALPLSLATAKYKERLDALMKEWRAANLALFDAQVAPLGLWLDTGKD